MVAQHMENRLHQPVYRKFGLGGTMLAQQGLLAKEIDMYPEYTGTGFTNVLKRQADQRTRPQCWTQVRAEYANMEFGMAGPAWDSTIRSRWR